jgi:cytochrome b6-f complex iron-sulfur subunit
MKINKSTPKSPDVETRESTLSRRAALCGIAAIVIGVNPEKAVAADGITMNAAGQVDVSLSANPGLKKVGGVVTFDLSNGSTIALVRTSASQSGFTALNLSCTHQGVTVMKSGAKCPAHRSAFALNGKVTKGPATSPLQSLKFKATAKNVLITV